MATSDSRRISRPGEIPLLTCHHQQGHHPDIPYARGTSSALYPHAGRQPGVPLRQRQVGSWLISAVLARRPVFPRTDKELSSALCTLPPALLQGSPCCRRPDGADGQPHRGELQERLRGDKRPEGRCDLCCRDIGQ